MCPLRCFHALLVHSFLASWVSAVTFTQRQALCKARRQASDRQKTVLRKLSALTRAGFTQGSDHPGAQQILLRTDLPLCLGSFFLGPRPPLWLSSCPTEKAPGGRGLVANNPHARHFSRLLFQNVNTLPHFRTRAPARTLKNKLHKHLWGAWSCHITGAATWGGGGRVTSRTQSGTVHKCQTHWAKSSGKHKPLGTTVRHRLGKESVI